MILEQAQQVLSGGKGMALADITERIPELCGRDEGQEILRLLLRLDRRFEQRDGLWFSKANTPNPSSRIIAATQAYFKDYPRGELLDHLVPAVVKATGESRQCVQEVILENFHSVQSGKMILNRAKG